MGGKPVGPRIEIKMSVVLIAGGTRSGKSAFALRNAESLGSDRLFVATAQIRDDEMRDRVLRHRTERGAGWSCLEEPWDLVAPLSARGGPSVVVIDCLTLWLSNLMERGDDDEALSSELDRLIHALHGAEASVVLVSSEVGLGIVPMNALARRFRDWNGTIQQRVAEVADAAFFTVMGRAVCLEPSDDYPSATRP